MANSSMLTVNRLACHSRCCSDRNKVVAVVREMIGRGEYPGRRKVDEALRRRGASLVRPELREAYRRAVGAKSG